MTDELLVDTRPRQPWDAIWLVVVLSVSFVWFYIWQDSAYYSVPQFGGNNRWTNAATMTLMLGVSLLPVWLLLGLWKKTKSLQPLRVMYELALFPIALTMAPLHLHESIHVYRISEMTAPMIALGIVLAILLNDPLRVVLRFLLREKNLSQRICFFLFPVVRSAGLALSFHCLLQYTYSSPT